MSALKRLFSAVGGAVKTIARGARDMLTSRNFSSSLSDAFRMSSSILTKMSGGALTLPTRVQEIPDFVGGVATMARTMIPKIRKDTSIIADVLFATGKNDVADARAVYSDLATTASGTAKLESFDRAVAATGGYIAQDIQDTTDVADSIEPGRIVTSSSVKTEEQYDAVLSIVRQAVSTVQTVASGSDIAPNAAVTTGNQDVWELCADVEHIVNIADTSGLGVAPTISGPVSTFAVTTGLQVLSTATWTQIVSEYVYKVGQADLPKTDCYDWETELEIRYSVSSASDLSAYGTIDLLVGVTNTVGGEQVSKRVRDFGTKRSNGVFKISYNPVTQSFIDIAVQVATATATLNLTFEVVGGMSYGMIKADHASCGVTHVTYFDGEEEMHLSANDNWLGIFGKVEKSVPMRFDYCSDPNLNVPRLWKDLTTGGDNLFRVVSLLHKAMIATAAGGSAGTDNHNTFLFTPFGTSLEEMANINVWIYKDGPFYNKTDDDKRTMINNFMKCVVSMETNLAAHTNLQKLFYEKLVSE